MKFKFCILIFLLISQISVAQKIQPQRFLALFSLVDKEKAVNLIGEDLLKLSPKWKFIGGSQGKNHISVKWHYPADYGSVQDAEFYLLTEKKQNNTLVTKAIYAFGDRELYNTYSESIKSLDGANIVNSELLADGSTRKVYEVKELHSFSAPILLQINNITALESIQPIQWQCSI